MVLPEDVKKDFQAVFLVGLGALKEFYCSTLQTKPSTRSTHNALFCNKLVARYGAVENSDGEEMFFFLDREA